MILKNIKSVEDLKNLSEKELPSLSKEIRKKIIDTIGKNGGHLASNLGVVELTIALHRVFNSPRDAIIWDVSHQCYTHKLLTGRYEKFDTLRQKDGLSGFTRIYESEHDYFDAGHASSSISSALGLLSAWSLQGRNDKVVAIIGDGALTGGMAYEALCHAGQLSNNLIVILNDNQMSISKNVGSLSRYLSKLTMSNAYQSLKYKINKTVDGIPKIGQNIALFIKRIKRGIKGLFFTNNLFVDLGFEYFGPLDGHNIKQLEKVFKKVSKINKPTIIHVVTKKGKGYVPAENDPASFHGVGPFNTSDGLVDKYDSLSFTEAFSSKLIELGNKDKRITCITAAMSKGTGLDAFSRHFKDRFFDVGIAEEHAVTFGAGLAAGGLIPIVAIYSTFIQRSIDQIIEDMAMQNRHEIICLDRAGAVPYDGETHQGIFDISLLRSIPNISFISVVSQKDLDICLDWACFSQNGPVIIRWPKLSCPSEFPAFSNPVEIGKGIFLEYDEFAPSLSLNFENQDVLGKILIVCTGSIFSEALQVTRSLIFDNYLADLYVLRFIKPFDEDYFLNIAKNYETIIFIEDGLKIAGQSEYLENLVISKLDDKKTKIFAFPDSFVSNGSRSEILESVGLSPEIISKEIKNLY